LLTIGNGGNGDRRTTTPMMGDSNNGRW